MVRSSPNVVKVLLAEESRMSLPVVAHVGTMSNPSLFESTSVKTHWE